MTPAFTALISLLGAVVVAVLSHWLSQRKRTRDELTELRLRAYVDFIAAASRTIAARRIGETTDKLEDLVTLNDAKTRVCLYAPPGVVRAMAKFWFAGGTLEKETEILAFSNLCQSIRQSLGNGADEISRSDLSQLLFQQEPSSLSFRVKYASATLAEANRAPEPNTDA